jgi:hypothetical protein
MVCRPRFAILATPSGLPVHHPLHQIALYTVVFVFSNWQPYVPHAQGTLDRLLLQALPTAVILLVSLLGESGSTRTGAVAVAAEGPSRAAAQAV